QHPSALCRALPRHRHGARRTGALGHQRAGGGAHQHPRSSCRLAAGRGPHRPGRRDGGAGVRPTDSARARRLVPAGLAAATAAFHGGTDGPEIPAAGDHGLHRSAAARAAPLGPSERSLLVGIAPAAPCRISPSDSYLPWQPGFRRRRWNQVRSFAVTPQGRHDCGRRQTLAPRPAGARRGEDAMKSLVIKRSIRLAGHKTSVSVEEAFWKALKEIAGGRDVTLSDLVATIDAARQQRNLSSAIRLFVLCFYRDRCKGGTRELVAD